MPHSLLWGRSTRDLECILKLALCIRLKAIAGIQYDMLKSNPYKYTSDDIIFAVYAQRNGIEKDKMKSERENFFSKGQPCMRSSPLVKRYGWGVHNNSESRIALYPVESEEYLKLLNNNSLKQLKGMRSKSK